jgi:hypothetical protein
VANAFRSVVEWQKSTGEDRYRRSIYTYIKRSFPHPLFETFDVSTREVCCLRRNPTNTPLQSFMTLNDQEFFEAAQALACRMAERVDINQQIAAGLELALARPADTMDVATLRRLYDRALREFEQDRSAAQLVVQASGPELAPGETEVPRDSIARRAALTVVANVILNLDSFLTR